MTDENRQYTETVPNKSGACIVCRHRTHDRTVQMRNGRVAYWHWRCAAHPDLPDHRAARKKRG